MPRTRIIIVDDEPAHIDAIRRALAAAGTDDEGVVAVGTLREYRAAVAECRPDIALVDLNLPDGRAVEILTSPPESGGFPVVIMTSHGDGQTAVEAMKAGALDYLVKSPEAFADIHHKISRALRQWQLLRERAKAMEDLVAAKEAAEAASRAKSDFLAVMNHELRTPLNGVTGAAELLLATELSSEQREYVDIIMTSARQQLALVNDLLEMSRIEAGSRELERCGFSLRKTLNSAVMFQYARIREKNLAITVGIDPAVPDEVVGDPVRFRQIVLNLLANAVKFTDTGSIAVEVDVAAQGADTVLIHCRVADTGIGIPDGDREKIFAPFVQGDMSPTRKYGGAGLGLGICRRLADAMGGRIWLESEEGKGSVFTVEVPFSHGEHPARNDQASARAAHVACDGNGAPLRALLVEDNAMSLKVFAGMLTSLRFSVTTAVNGMDALERWRSDGPFDVVLMDVQMPVMGGEEAMLAIRELEREGGGHVPIIAQTAFVSQDDRDRLLAAGFDGFLAKPFMLGDLVEQLKLVMEVRE